MYNIIFSFKFDEDVHMNIIWSKKKKKEKELILFIFN